MEGHAKIGIAAAAVDDDRDGHWVCPEPADDVEGFLDTPAFGDDILRDQDFFPGLEFEAASQGEFVVLLFQENVALPGLACDFLADDEASHGGGDNGFEIQAGYFFPGEFGHAGDGGHVLADLGALEKMAAVQAGAQDKVTFVQCTGGFKKAEDFFLWGVHGLGNQPGFPWLPRLFCKRRVWR